MPFGREKCAAAREGIYFISHCDEGAIFHNSRSELFHIRHRRIFHRKESCISVQGDFYSLGVGVTFALNLSNKMLNTVASYFISN